MVQQWIYLNKFSTLFAEYFQAHYNKIVTFMLTMNLKIQLPGLKTNIHHNIFVLLLMLVTSQLIQLMMVCAYSVKKLLNYYMTLSISEQLMMKNMLNKFQIMFVIYSQKIQLIDNTVMNLLIKNMMNQLVILSMNSHQKTVVFQLVLVKLILIQHTVQIVNSATLFTNSSQTYQTLKLPKKMLKPY